MYESLDESLHKSLYESLHESPDESLYESLDESLELELAERVSTQAKCRVHVPPHSAAKGLRVLQRGSVSLSLRVAVTLARAGAAARSGAAKRGGAARYDRFQMMLPATTGPESAKKASDKVRKAALAKHLERTRNPPRARRPPATPQAAPHQRPAFPTPKRVAQLERQLAQLQSDDAADLRWSCHSFVQLLIWS